jgi:hypothetical protein
MILQRNGEKANEIYTGCSSSISNDVNQGLNRYPFRFRSIDDTSEVDDCELVFQADPHTKLRDRRPFGLWLVSYRRDKVAVTFHQAGIRAPAEEFFMQD